MQYRVVLRRLWLGVLSVCNVWVKWGLKRGLVSVRCQLGLFCPLNYGPVAQLDRVLASEARGHRFESCRDHQTPIAPISCLERDIRAYFCLSDSGFPNWVRCDSLPSRQIWGLQMGKPHPIELRTRVVAFVDEGHGHREAARHFRVSPKFVNDLIKLRRVTGSLLPRPQGNGGGHGKLTGVTDWIDARVTAKGEITLDELVAELAEAHGIDVHRGTVWRVLRGLGLTHKKRPAGA
jgi:transposase